ncbi:MAG: hypothetical protein AB8H86_10250 [Polyangiales bacterium]
MACARAALIGITKPRSWALRLVFSVALQPACVARCLGLRCDPSDLWPSVLYANLACAHCEDAAVQERTHDAIGKALKPELVGLSCLSCGELVQLFCEGRSMMTLRELAAVLWLVSEQASAGETIQRLAEEFSHVAVSARFAESSHA